MVFIRPTLEQQIARSETEIASRLGLGALVPRGMLTGLARAIAGMFHGFYGYVQWGVRQGIPDQADPETVEALAADYGVNVKPATFANGPVTFTGTNGSSIPAGTLLQRADGARYETLDVATIASGTAEVEVQAVDAGVAANAAAGTQLTATSPIVGVSSAVVVAAPGLLRGADEESPEELLERFIERLRNTPQGGSPSDYIGWARSIAGVTRAWALEDHFGVSTVGVTFAMDGNASPIPTGADVNAVQAYIDDPTRRPLPAKVTVFAPAAVVVNFTIDALQPNTPEVRSAIEAALKACLLRAFPSGPKPTVLRLSHLREAISNAPGEIDHVLVVPAADVPIAAGQLPVFGAITWT